jgi:two-component system cell cycle sensor histidine kinase/response regulator CckA
MTDETIQVLLVEDTPADVLIVKVELRDAPGIKFAVTHVERVADALQKLAAQPFGMVLLDLNLPDSNGFETFANVHEAYPDVPIIILSGQTNVALAVKAVKAGALDYLVKGHFEDQFLARSIRHAIERLRGEVVLAHKNAELVARNHALVQSEESLKLFRALVEQSNDAIMVIDPRTGRFLDCNETAWKRLGYTREELLSIGVTDVEVDVATLASLSESMEEIKTIRFKLVEGRHRRKDGSTFPVEVNIRYVDLNSGYVIVVVRDTTERKLAEDKVMKQVQELQRWREVTLGRETRIQSLKLEVNETLLRQGVPSRYGKPESRTIGKPEADPLPADHETGRLATLRNYEVLDTPAEMDFDELVALAAQICETPIAQITLVDENRQWFKATFGLVATETPRDVSFCEHAILQSEVFIVPDATLDERFADNSLVTGPPGIRFYAGSPLIAPNGYALGTLCVIDRRPREMTAAQQQALSVLSRHVMAQLELRRQAREMKSANIALLGILEDEEHAETAVRKSEGLNRGVLNSVLAHIAVLDHEGTIIAVNDGWRQFARENPVDDHEVLPRTDVGTNYLEVCRTSKGDFSAKAKAAYDGLKSVLEGTRENFTVEYPCHGRGQKRWFVMSATPLKTESGGAAVSHMDITKRKEDEERIAEQAALLDKAQDAILVRDLQGGILFWNKGAERMYGWLRQDVLGRNIGAVLYTDPKKFEEVNGLAISQGEWQGELQHLTKNRGEITIEARWTLIRDDEGLPKSVLAINTDITEKKKIEAQFMRAQRMESIGTLAGGIAHDLNNILAPIMMSIDILKLTSDNPQAKSILQTIEVSAKRGADIVKQVLSFARGLDGERIEIQPRHLLKDLESIIKDTFPKNIQLHFEVPNDTWLILGDPTQVHQILLNLCVNARDAMPNGGRLTVSVENCVLDEQYVAMNINAKVGHYLKIGVTDSGTGMPPDIVDKIFEPFFTTKDISKGTGLGLSTVMAIVKSHEGTITVYSEQGKGTIFSVYLPAIETASDTKREASVQASLPRGNGETVLIVDDEASILTITSQTLQAFGYRVLTASDGAEALAMYVQHRHEIGVVLTDMMMPVMDGLVTIHALKRINPLVKVIAASGLNTDDKASKASAIGVKHFLTKPYTAGTLLKILRMILDEA